ncbi:MAG: RnfABCDGE type electron transport complex subunit D [bacterium]
MESKNTHLKILSNVVKGILYGTDSRTEHAPHILDHLELKRYMFFVIIALMPSVIASVYFFGTRVIKIILVSYIFGGIVEVAFALIRKKDIEEGFFVTGLIFPLILPPTVPLWIVASGIIFGTFFGKEVFGGTGRNIFNPALTGRVFITIAFPEIMTASWQVPLTDAITSATPLTMFKTEHFITSYRDLLMGNVSGSLGETFRLGIIIGGVFLMWTKVSNWRVPFSYLGSVFMFSLAGNMLFPSKIAPFLFQLLSGGLLFCAMFMATDPVTSPFTREGKYVFGVLCGLFTVLIRSFSGYVEGVMFSILLMNAFSPLIDQVILKIKYKPLA